MRTQTLGTRRRLGRDLCNGVRVTVELTVLTWNVQGSKGLDVADVAAIVVAARPDAVLIQEIGRRQATRLARALGMGSVRWCFKHRPPGARAEGLAIISPHDVAEVRSFVLRRAPRWSWRRRVGLAATVLNAHGAIDVVNVHLSPHDASRDRVLEAQNAVDAMHARGRIAIVGGDLNDGPDAPVHEVFRSAGWIDSSSLAPVGVGVNTAWRRGSRRGRSPDQRLDYILVPDTLDVVRSEWAVDVDELDRVARLSDHVPVIATVGLRPHR